MRPCTRAAASTCFTVVHLVGLNLTSSVLQQTPTIPCAVTWQSIRRKRVQTCLTGATTADITYVESGVKDTEDVTGNKVNTLCRDGVGAMNETDLCVLDIMTHKGC